MSKEKLQNLVAYLATVKSRLSDTVVPEKHKGREKTYREYLKREIEATTNKIETLRYSDGK